MVFGMKKRSFLGSVFFVTAIVSAQGQFSGAPQQGVPDASATYQKACATCHENASKEGRVPGRDSFRMRPPEAILATITTGSMKPQAASLTDAERRSLAEYLAGGTIKGEPAKPGAGACAKGTGGSFDPTKGARWNGWGVEPTNSRFQTAAMAGLTIEQVRNLKLKWAFGFPGVASAFAQPTVAGGRVFVGSASGMVYSLDSQTGCTHWSFQASSGVRTAISVGPIGRRQAIYFGDLVSTTYALDAVTGALIWKNKLDDHPLARVTGAPSLYSGRLYVPVTSIEEVVGRDTKYECCKFRGYIAALDSATGKEIWRSYSILEEAKPTKMRDGHQLWGPAGAGIWNSPTIDVKRKAIYAGTGDAYTEPAADTSDAVIALDMHTGKMLWSKQVTPADAFLVGCGPTGGAPNCPEKSGPDFDIGNSPILKDLPGGKSMIVVGQKSGILFGLDPDKKGEIIWQFRAGKGSALGGIQWGPAADADNAYVAVSDPILPKPGGMFAVKIASGQKVWETPAPEPPCKGQRGCNAGQSAAVTAIPGVVFSGSLDGHMRAYSSEDGRILWDFDAVKEFQTVNEVKAKGGSFDAAGPTVAGGMVFMNSGYNVLGMLGMPGNVLLALAPEKPADKP